MDQQELANKYFVKHAAMRATADGSIAARLVNDDTRDSELRSLATAIEADLVLPENENPAPSPIFREAFAAQMAAGYFNPRKFRVFMIDPKAAYVMDEHPAGYTILIPAPPNKLGLVRGNSNTADPTTQSTTNTPCTGG